jgi:hypothetical protein
MQEYIINVSGIEELQTIKNIQELDAIFRKAKSTIVNGEKVLLVRRYADGRTERFDEITTEEELAIYKKGVYKYL